MKSVCSGLYRGVAAASRRGVTHRPNVRQHTSLPFKDSSYSASNNSHFRSRVVPLLVGVAAGGYLLLTLDEASNEDNATNSSAPSTQTQTPTATKTVLQPKKKIVVLGSGWAALEFVRSVDTNLFDVVVVSPKNYFLYTPLLPSAAVGTLELRSVTEPIRKFCKRSGSDINFYEAACIDIDYKNNKITCEDSSEIKGKMSNFTLDYDKLVVAVGSVNVTMGVKGVVENCQFLKEAPDVVKIRDRLMDCFESSNLPGQPEDERRRLLQFVVVGGGPTGVEFAAELYDFVKEDLKKFFPEIVKDVKITLVQSAEHILNTYDAKIQEYAEKEFKRDQIDLRVNARVVEVTQEHIVVLDKKTQKQEIIPFGMCVWSAGVGPNPLAMKLAGNIEEQKNKRALVTDEYLQVKGTSNIYAIGDCASVSQKKLLEVFVDIFKAADTNNDGVLSLHEFTDLITKYQKTFPQLETYGKEVEKYFIQFDKDKNGTLDLEEFKTAITSIDRNMKALPTTAQCASQQGKYLGQALTQAENKQLVDPFKYKHFGSFAYVGGDHAVADIPGTVQSGGWGVWWLWRATYFSKQMSIRNRVLVGFDWIKAFIFGRDISRV